jgi:amino acid transporter
MSEEKVFVRRASGLVRAIGPWSALIFAFGMPGIFIFGYLGMWGAGLYPQAYMPLGVIMLLILLPVMAVYYLLGVAMPRSGGEYIYVSRILHPLVGFFTSWIFSIIFLVWTADVAKWSSGIGIGYALMEAGLFMRDQALYNVGYNIYSYMPLRFVISVALILIMAILIWRGPRLTSIGMWVCAILSTVGLIAYVAGLAMYGKSIFVDRLMEWSGVNYDAVIQQATNLGRIPEFTLEASLMAGASYIIFETLGNQSVCSIAGEIKTIHKALPLALFGSIGLFMLYWGLGYYYTFEGLGSHFISSISYLAGLGVYPLGVEPMWHYLFAYAVPNIVWAILPTICFIFSDWAVGLGSMFFSSRNWFAWAFDRMIPPQFSKVDERGSPWAVILLCTIIAIIFAYIDIFLPEYMYWMLFTITLWGLGWVIVGLTAVLFPRKKEIFEKSPGIVKRKVLGIPIISVLGLLCVIVGAYVMYCTIVPVVGAPGVPSAAYWQTLAILIFAPIIIYLSSYTYWKRKGIPMDLQFKEIPPE